MRLFFTASIFVLCLFTISCAPENNETPTTQVKPEIESFEAYFSTFDSLSPTFITEWKWGTEDSTLKGKKIDRQILNSFIDTSFQQKLENAQDFYGVFHIPLNDSISGYLVRTQLSNIDYMQSTFLMIWNHNKYQWTAHAKIAGFVGAEGFINQMSALLTEKSETGREFAIRQHEWTYNPTTGEKVNDVVYVLNWNLEDLNISSLTGEQQNEFKQLMPLK